MKITVTHQSRFVGLIMDREDGSPPTKVALTESEAFELEQDINALKLEPICSGCLTSLTGDEIATGMCDKCYFEQPLPGDE